MIGDFKKNSYTYYRHVCSEIGKQLYIKEEEVFTLLDEEMKKVQFLSNSFTFLKEELKIFKGYSKDNPVNLQEIQKKISNLEMKKKKLLDLGTEDDIGKEDLRKKYHQYEKDIKDLLRKRSILENKYDDKILYGINDIIDTTQEFPLIYQNISNDGKADILKKFAEKAIYVDGIFRIVWRKLFNFIIRKELLTDAESSQPSCHAPPTGQFSN